MYSSNRLATVNFAYPFDQVKVGSRTLKGRATAFLVALLLRVTKRGGHVSLAALRKLLDR